MPASTMKYGGKRFRLVTKTRLKSNAKKKAEVLRDKGLTARLGKIGKMHAVYAGPKSKN